MQTKKLNDERSTLGQAKSDVVLIMPYTTTLQGADKEYCLELIKEMREKVPGISCSLKQQTIIITSFFNPIMFHSFPR